MRLEQREVFGVFLSGASAARARHTDTVVVPGGHEAGAGLSAETEAGILERKKQPGGGAGAY